MKTYSIEMPDGSIWAIPVEVIARNRAAYYAEKEFNGDIERSLKEDTWPLFEADPYEVKDWAANNMNFSDVQAVAVCLKAGSVDFEEGWRNGEKKIF